MIVHLLETITYIGLLYGAARLGWWWGGLSL